MKTKIIVFLLFSLGTVLAAEHQIGIRPPPAKQALINALSAELDDRAYTILTEYEDDLAPTQRTTVEEARRYVLRAGENVETLKAYLVKIGTLESQLEATRKKRLAENKSSAE